LDWRCRHREAAERRRLIAEMPELIAHLLWPRIVCLLKLGSRSETGRPKQATALPRST
jgi:hypothetical protein